MTAMPESIPNPNRWKILRIQLVMAFMVALDNYIASIALPNISIALSAPVSSITWVVTSYHITICATVLFFGRLGDIKGSSLMFKSGCGLFTVGSLLCGVSINLAMLIIARVIQAIGAAAFMAVNQGIVTRAFPPNERGRALGFNGTIIALGALLGPPIGGFIVSILSWHFLFLINVPIGIAVFLLGNRIMPKDVPANESLDTKGFVLFALSALLIFGAIGTGRDVQFSNPLIFPAILAGLALLVIFILVERRQKQPMLDFSIFRNSTFTIGVICTLLVYASLSTITLIQPFFLQNARGLSPSAAGLLFMIYPVVLGATSPLAGFLADKIGPKAPSLVGLCLSTTGYICAALATIETSLVFTGVVYAILGMGNALFQSPNFSLLMSSVPNNKLGAASSTNALLMTIGMVLGVLVSTTVLFATMSALYGQPVNDYIQGRPDLFIHGMRAAYFVVAGICFTGAILAALRLFVLRKK